MELTKNITWDKNEEYTDNLDKLKELLKEIKIYIGEPRLLSYFEEDKKSGSKRNTYTVDVKRGDIKISFKYGDSIDNTEKHKSPTLDDVLNCIKSDFFCPEDFKEFCGEYGYDKDSIKAKDVFKKLKRMSQKLHSIFTEEEMEWLPN